MKQAGGGVERVITHLPSGSIIGLRSSRDHARGRISQQALLELWAGKFVPQSGSCECLLRTAYVGRDDLTLFPGTLIENLLHWTPAGGNTEYDSLVLYSLCKRGGISTDLIGETPTGTEWPEGEQIYEAGSLKNLDREDVARICLMRAVLTLPDVLLMFRVADDWPIERQRDLFTLAQDYLEGSLDDLLHFYPLPRSSAASKTPPRATRRATHASAVSSEETTEETHHINRTVVIAATDAALNMGLQSTDLVLTLHSVSEGTLHLKNDVLHGK